MAKNRLPVSKKPVPVKIVYDSPKTTSIVSEDKKYKIESGLRTLREAEKIKSDKGLMKDIKALAKEETKALSKIK